VFTNDTMKTLFLRVMDRMIEAGWLHSHTFTDGKGYHLAWTPSGTRRSIILKKISTYYRLLSEARAPLTFDRVAHGDQPPDFVPPFELHATVANFWRECVAQLGLRGDEDGLRALIHIVQGWKPCMNTPLRIDGVKAHHPHERHEKP
jgi:hypothetical protein